VQKENAKELPELAQRILAGILEHFNKRTILEFKSPLDALTEADIWIILSYLCAYRAKAAPLLPQSELNLVIIAPRMTEGFQRALEAAGIIATNTETGKWKLEGGVLDEHEAWLLETAHAETLGSPLLMVFSPQMVRNPKRVQEKLKTQGLEMLFQFVAQQVAQFQLKGEKFNMQHAELPALEDIFQQIIMNSPVEARLKGLSPEEIRKAVPPEEFFKQMTPEELEQLRRWLDQKPPAG
jgi:hypothetical protein